MIVEQKVTYIKSQILRLENETFEINKVLTIEKNCCKKKNTSLKN